MANSTVIQVRASEEDKKRASEILEQLGTNHFNGKHSF